MTPLPWHRRRTPRQTGRPTTDPTATEAAPPATTPTAMETVPAAQDSPSAPAAMPAPAVPEQSPPTGADPATRTVQVRGPAALGVGGDMSGNALGPGSQVANIHQLIQQFGAADPHHEPVDLAEVEEAVTRYSERLRQAYSRLDLEVLLPTTEPEHPQVGLREVFVPPSLRADPPRVGLPPALAKKMTDHGEQQPEEEPRRPDGPRETVGRRPAGEERPPVELLRTLADPHAKRLVLLGNPGAGKSTLARYLALTLAGRALPESLAQLAGRLPVIVELRRYAEAEWRERTFEDFLEHLCTMEDLCVPRRVLETCLRGGRAVVIFDGLDELFDPAVRAEVTRRIAAFAARYDQARIIVTSRVIGYQRPVLDGVGFRHYMIQDLTEEQIHTFVRLWYDTVCPYDPTLAERLRRRIIASVAHSRPVRELAGNPLLLTILAIIGRRQELPRDRQGVYEHAVNVLIAHWDLDAKHLPPLPDAESVADLDVRHRRELLRLLARQMQDAGDEGGGNLIHGSDLQATFCTYLTENWEFPPLRADAAARAMLRQFQERNFILSHFGGEVYGFVHRTFLEYLAAADLAQRYSDREFTDDQLIEDVFARRAGDSTWHEVLLLLVGQLHERVAARAIDKLLALHAADTSESEILALSVRCLAEVRNIGRLSAQSESVVNALITHLSYTRSTGLESVLPAMGGFGQHWSGRRIYLRWFYVLGQHPREAGDISARIACALYQDAAMPVALAEHALSPAVRVAALRSLAERWPEHDGLERLLRDRSTSDDDTDVRAAAVELLAARPADDGSIRDFLHERAVTDTEERIREAALRALADRCPADPDVRELFPRYLRTAGSWSGQKEVIAAAARHWPADPVVPQLLLDSATRDSAWAWRDTALEGLVAHWPDHPELPALLRDRAVADPDEFVRRTALTSLAELRADDGEVRDLLVERAVADAHPDPREAALTALGEHWRADPAVRRLLLDRAVTDPDPGPREAAVDAVVDYGPDVRALLLDRATADPHEKPRIAALRALSESGDDDPAVLELFLDRLVSDPSGAAREHILRLHAGHRPEHPALRELLSARATADLHGPVRKYALSLLAERWPEDSEVLALLFDRATADLHEGARDQALESLASCRRDDPAVRDLLLDRAVSDLQKLPRSTALVALAEFWGEDPAARSLFCRLATTDPDASFRDADLGWLAWKAQDDTVVRLLRERALHDPAPTVRKWALCLLAFSRPADPGVLALLRDRAERDESEVRQAAVDCLALAATLARLQDDD